uniref:Uncharacterized protein n=1 Tax=Tetraselmis sp. GSL018 TaxID=582737 RepID=A0A061RHL4_9CHLO|mmetsp:Transcript_40528/g.96304  ORF Transcript_40528/g.96304 Transcript_40528/m.96304 type:complete len:209 (+) Transcript_40528:198-824(+)
MGFESEDDSQLYPKSELSISAGRRRNKFGIQQFLSRFRSTRNSFHGFFGTADNLKIRQRDICRHAERRSWDPQSVPTSEVTEKVLPRHSDVCRTVEVGTTRNTNSAPHMDSLGFNVTVSLHTCESFMTELVVSSFIDSDVKPDCASCETESVVLPNVVNESTDYGTYSVRYQFWFERVVVTGSTSISSWKGSERLVSDQSFDLPRNLL